MNTLKSLFGRWFLNNRSGSTNKPRRRIAVPKRPRLTLERLEERELLSTTILSEGFEGNFPEDNGWQVGDSNSAGVTAYWNDKDASFGGEGTHGGNWKGYAAGVGYAGTTSNPSYRDSMSAFMSRGLNLSGLSSATVSFYFKMPSIESCCDRFRAYIDSTKVFEVGSSVTSWTQATISLNPYLGGSRTLKFEFYSDGSVTAEGAYLDDILVTAEQAVVDTTRPTATLGSLTPPTGGSTFDFPVTYSDNVAINVSTLDGSDIRVTGPNSFNQAASLVSVNSSSNGTPRTATYRITAPGGSWDSADNGTFTVGLQSTQVGDTSGNTALSATLGTFSVNISSPGQTINGSLASSDAPSHARSGSYADYYTLTGSGSATLTMTGFDTYLYLYNSSLQQIASDDDSAGNLGSRIVYTLQSGQTYYIEATSFSSGVTGNYTLAASAGNMSATGNPWVSSDTTRPTATLGSLTAPNAGATFDFPVTYSDNVAINVSTLDGSDIRVTGPNSFNQAASLVSVNSSSNGTPRTATYRINAPGGSWDSADNGTFTVGLQSTQVADTSGNTALSATLGTFNVNISSGGNSDDNDQISEATALGSMTQTRTWPNATIDAPADVDMFTFTVTAGQRIIFDIDRPSGSLDSYIRLFNSSGTQLTSNDDGPNPTESSTYESYLDYTFSSSDTYYLGVSGYGNSSYDSNSGSGDANGSTGQYSLIVSPGFAGLAIRGTESSPVDILRYGDNPGPIDPTQTTWVVMHGWNSSRDGYNNNIRNLAQAIRLNRPTDQVLTLDWHDAAAGTSPYTPEQWIVPVAEWAARTLQAYGFVGSRLNFVGHSFGSYVADETAERISGGMVNTIVALDPAANAPFGYDPDIEVNFDVHSAFAWAFYASAAGNETTSQTADVTIRVFNSDHTNVVPLFSDMLIHSNPVSQRFALTRLVNHETGPWDPDEYNNAGGRSHGSLVDAVLTAVDGGIFPQSLRYIRLNTDPLQELTEYA